MKAYVYRRYGGPEVIEMAELPMPAPGPGEILVRIHATTVSSADWRIRSLTLPPGFGLMGRPVFGFLRPRQPVLGAEFAGLVEAAGAGVTQFGPGDAVIGFPGGRLGSHAEYRTIRADGPVARKPDNLSFEEAATLSFGGSTALHYLRKAAVRPGERLLVIGASGAVGVALVQIARARGMHVTGVTSAANAALVAGLGAERVIDYTAGPVFGEGAAYDVIADTVGATRFRDALPYLNEGGRFLGIVGSLGELFARRRGSRRPVNGPAEERASDIAELAALAAGGALKPVIDGVYPFSQMRAAHARVDTGRKRGSVVVRVTD
ncbi:MAG: NAD(P)-dependent alcohol dehydrogenase [Micropepsaceae bacterium]